MKKHSRIRKLMILFFCTMLMAAFPTSAMATDTANDTSESTIDISVSVQWLDYNTGGHPDDNLTIDLYRGFKSSNEEPVYITSQEIAADGPSITFSGLPRYDENGNEYEYTVDEESVDGYTTAISGDQDIGFTVVNTLSLGPKSVTVTKKWVGEPMDEIEVNLLADGEIYDEVTLSASNSNWRYTWDDLPRFSEEDGHEINYTVDEDPIYGYNTSINYDGSEWVITNTQQTNVSVRKVWNDGDGENRPDNVAVQLYADGVAMGSKIILSENNAWEYTWDELDKYNSDGSEIEYTVKEDEIDGYKTEVTQNGNNFTITNTAKTSVSVNKEWNDGDGENRPDSVQVQLYADGEATGEKITLNAENSWTYTWSDLDKYDSNANKIEYTVKEDEVDGYETEVTQDGNDFTVTNTAKTIDIPVSKKWASSTTKKPVTVELYRNGNATGITKTLDESNEWKDTFTGQLEYDSTGTKYIYTVKEITDDYTWSISGSADEGFVITNSSREITVGDPPVRKTITGDKPSKDSRFYFTMTANPEKSTLPTGMTEMPMPTAAGSSQSMTIAVDGEGSGEFGDITFTEPGTYVYDVREKNNGVKGYNYDDTVYEVRYVVKETDDSTTGEHNVLTCERTILKDGIVQSSMTFAFTNKYTSSNSGSTDEQDKKNQDGQSGQGSNSVTTSKKSSKISVVSAIRTGDILNLGLWTAVMTASAAGIAICLFLRKRLSNRK